MMCSTTRTSLPERGLSKSFRKRMAFAGLVMLLVVRTDGEQVDLERKVDRPGQVREEEHGSLEYRDHQEVLPLIIARDLCAQLCEPGSDRLGIQVELTGQSGPLLRKLSVPLQPILLGQPNEVLAV